MVATKPATKAPTSSRSLKATAPRVKPTFQRVDATQDIIRIDSSLTPSPPSPSSPSSSSSPPPTFSSFAFTAKEVTSLGATKLAKWDRRAHEKRQSAAMGMRSEKNIKTPLKMLQGMNRKNEMRRERTEVRQRESGLKIKSSKRKRREGKGEERRGGGDGVGLDRVSGKDGMVRVSNFTADKLARGDKRMSMAKRLKS